MLILLICNVLMSETETEKCEDRTAACRAQSTLTLLILLSWTCSASTEELLTGPSN